MAPNILLPQFFLPLSAVALGRFVISLKEPHQDFHDPVCDSGPDITVKEQIQFDSTRHSINNSAAASQLTAFLSSSFSKRLKASVRITADQAKTYYLNNAGKWFRDAVKSQETREWVEGIIDEGESIYVVVAYHTLVDARIAEQLGGQSAIGGNVAIPVSTALSASGVVIPFTPGGDPGFGGFRGHLEDEKRQFIAPGEQIYAVQYRKVRWKWFARNRVDETTLAMKTWWETYDGMRNLQSEPENAIEVELEDEIALEEDHQEYATLFGEVFVP